jgi:hypothetical protein
MTRRNSMPKILEPQKAGIGIEDGPDAAFLSAHQAVQAIDVLDKVLPILSQAEEQNEEWKGAPTRCFGGGTAVRGYMCLTDWEYEIGYSWKGNKVYPSLHALQDHHKCWAECGVVEVEVRSVRFVVPEDHSEAIAAAILHAAPIGESADKPEA